ncbi:MAG: hypothetical protein R6U54_02895 [Candidatus Omnitrophota bacterium]
MKKNKMLMFLKETVTAVLLVGFVMGILTVTGCQQEESTWLDEQQGESQPAESAEY